MMQNDHHDAWVCVDCYFAHHYGVRAAIQGTDHLAPTILDRDETAGYQADGWNIIWLVGPDYSYPESVADREPLDLFGSVELADNTCSNHYYGQDEAWELDESEWPVCDQCGQRGYEDGINTFSSRSCQGCGSNLGGARYRLAVFMKEDA